MIRSSTDVTADADAPDATDVADAADTDVAHGVAHDVTDVEAYS